jgi:hypothetical protein
VYGNLGNNAEARNCYREAFQILSWIKARPLIIQAINRCAEIFMREGKKELALVIFTYILNSPAAGEKRRENVRKTISEFPAPDVTGAVKKVANMTIEAIVQEITKNL